MPLWDHNRQCQEHGQQGSRCSKGPAGGPLQRLSLIRSHWVGGLEASDVVRQNPQPAESTPGGRLGQEPAGC